MSKNSAKKVKAKAPTKATKKRSVAVNPVPVGKVARTVAAIRKSLAGAHEKTAGLEKLLTQATSQSKTTAGGPAVGNAPTSPHAR